MQKILGVLAAIILCISTTANAADTMGEFQFVASCTISGLGYSDNSFTKSFQIFRKSSTSQEAFLVGDYTLMTKIGENLDSKTRTKMYPMAAKDGVNSKKQAVTTYTFGDGVFNEDYSQIVVPKNPERFTKFFPLTWGAHDYFCTSYNGM